MKSKTIILSATEQKSGRGILTIYSEDNLLKCRIRLYNVEKLKKTCKLGIYHNNNVFSANILETNGCYETSLVGDFDINQDFYTAIVDTTLNNKVLLSGGTYSGHYFNDYSVFENVEKPENVEFLNNLETEKNNVENLKAENVETENVEIKNNLINSSAGFNSTNNLANAFSEWEQIEHAQPKTNLIKPLVSNQELKDCNANCNQCQNCIYKQFFYENTQNVEIPKSTLSQENVEFSKTENVEKTINVEINQNVEKPENVEFLNTQQTESEIKNVENLKTENVENSENAELKEKLIKQFNYVFENYPENTELSSLIENSKFVKIEENNNNYSIGAIYKNNALKVMCYAVKSNYNSPPPSELGKNYQWLPLDKEDPLSDGYYLVFQDAEDFKILEL